MSEVIIATIVLLLVIAIGVLKIIKLDGGLFLQDIRFFFLLSFTLYIVFLPIVYCLYSEIFFFNQNIFTKMVWLYASAILAYDIVLFKKNIKWKNSSLIYPPYKSYKRVIYGLICLVACSFYYMKSRGVVTFSLGEGMADRSEYGEAVSQSWIILSIVVAVFFNFTLFIFRKLNTTCKLIFLSCLAFYVTYQISLGNRREYTTIILFFVCYYLGIRKIPLNIKLLCFLVAGFIGSFAITIIRDANTRDLSRSDKIQMAIISNEFIYPQQTTYYTMEANPDYKLGYSYTILPIEVAIPRSIYPNKPATLASEFVTKILNTTQGYAYTPVTEAFINFGYIGPFVIFYILALFLNNLVKEANEKGISFKYAIFFAYSFDFCRSEFSSVAYSFLFIYLSYKLIILLVGRIKSPTFSVNSTNVLEAD